MSYRTILLFGAPGMGKGTQGKALGALPGFFHCSSGDLFRSLKPGTPLGQLVETYANRGELVPDAPSIQIWQQFMDDRIQAGRFRPGQDILLLDGIPRTVAQAELLQNTLEVAAVFNLRCTPADVLIQRLQSRALIEGRRDDASPEVVRTRLEVYERESKPVLQFYDPRLQHDIDAGQPPAKVLFDILDCFLKL
jgi:adenylate kinase